MKTYTLEEIKELCEKATRGPWHHGELYNVSISTSNSELHRSEICSFEPTLRDVEYDDTERVKEVIGNGNFIAASRTIVPQLVGQLEKAIKALKEVKKQHAPDTLANMIKRKPQCYDLAEQALKELGVE